MIKNIDYAVHMAMQDLQETDTTNYQQYLQWAIFCLTNDIKFKYRDQVKTVYLEMSDVKTVTLPPDYLVYTKIGYVYCGNIITLTLNNNLISRQQLNPCNTIEEALIVCNCEFGVAGGTDNGNARGTDNIENAWGVFPYITGFRNGQYIGENYGLGGGFNIAYYKVFEEQGIIQIKGNVPHGTIALEYKSSGIEEDGSILIDQKVVPAIRTYIHLQKKLFSPVSMAEKELWQHKYDVVMGQLADMTGSFTLSEYLDVHYRSTKLSPKR